MYPLILLGFIIIGIYAMVLKNTKISMFGQFLSGFLLATAIIGGALVSGLSPVTPVAEWYAARSFDKVSDSKIFWLRSDAIDALDPMLNNAWKSTMVSTIVEAARENNADLPVVQNLIEQREYRAAWILANTNKETR